MSIPPAHNGELLKQYLKSKKIRQEDFANNLNISRNYLITKLKEFTFKDDFKQKVITNLGVDESFFESNYNSVAQTKSAHYTINTESLNKPSINTGKGVPYYDIDFMGGFDLVFNEQAIQPTFYIDFLPFNDCDCWINVTGKSMGPLIAHGDIVGLKKVEDWRRFLLEGEIYAIVTDNGFRTIKMLGPGDDNDHYKLIPYNKGEEYKPQSIPKDVITHIFRVKGNIKKFF